MEKEKNVNKKRLTRDTNVKRPKSLLKRMGHKSTLLFNDNIIVTSVAKDKNSGKNGDISKSHIEYLSTVDGTRLGGKEELLKGTTVSRENVTIKGKICNPDRPADPAQVRTVETENPSILINNNICETQIPRKTDYLGIKSALEKTFFGKTFNDNVRIQIAYNILDIKKIMSVTINNIVSMFYNLNRAETVEDNVAPSVAEKDMIGMMPTYRSYDEESRNANSKTFAQVEALLKDTVAYHTYFDRAFTSASREAKKDGVRISKNGKGGASGNFEKYERKAMEINYDVLRLLAIGRQIVVHGEIREGGDKKGKISSVDALFDIENWLTQKDGALSARLKRIYYSSAKQVDDSFKEGAVTNCYILSKLYTGESKQQLLNDYYRYAILKEDQCLGISVNAIKEIILEKVKKECPNKNTEYSNENKRFYVLCNFVLWRFLTKSENASRISKLTEELRACCDNGAQTAEERKKSAYRNFASKLWFDGLRDQIFKLYDLAVSNYCTIKSTTWQLDKNTPVNGALSESVNDVNLFVKYIYFLSEFLDGKEVNVFFNDLIQKFSNIAEIVQTVNDVVAVEPDKKIRFLPQYVLFEDSAAVAKQLRLARNIKHATLRARINDKVEDEDSKMAPSRQNIFDALYMLIGEKETINDYKHLIWDEDENGNLKPKPPKQNKARNFIINNVILSKRFTYISKYCDPRTCSKIMHNKDAITFAMSSVPDTQMEKYYKRVVPKGSQKSGANETKIRNTVIEEIMKFSLKTVLTGIAGDTCSVENRERAVGLIQLYLTVAYIITKSFVNINQRFLLAFSCLERDAALILPKGEYNNANPLELTAKYLTEDISFEEKYREEKARQIKPDMSQEEKDAVYKVINRIYKQKHYAESVTRPRDPNSPKDKSCAYLVSNLEEAKKIEPVISQFKNAIDHLNVVRNAPNYFEDIKEVNSFYGMYCYALQNLLADKMIRWKRNDNNTDESVACINETGKKLKQNLNEFRTYNKDFMWVINMPFAYNFPRYKNLSSEYLFYDMEYKITPDAQKPGDRKTV